MRTHTTRGPWRACALLLATSLLMAGCGAGEVTTTADPEEPGDAAETAPLDAPQEGTEGLTIEVRYASYLGEATTAQQEVAWWMDRVVELVEDTTPHTIVFDTFLDASLLPQLETVAALQDGRIDAGLVPPASFPGELPLNQISTIPFLSESPMAALRANAELSAEHAAVRGEWEAAGIVPVMWVAAGNAAAGFREPIASIDDLEGMRLRSIGLHGEALAALGVDPVAMVVAEMYEALERGVLDGFATLPFVTGFIGLGMVEVAPHAVDLGLGQFTSAVGVGFGRDTWDELPTDVQDVMWRAAEETYDEFIPGNLEPQDEAACDAIVEQGGSVVRLSEDEIEAWRELALDDIVDSWVDGAVEAGVDEPTARSLIEEYQATEARFAADVEYVDGLTACVERAH